MVCPEIKLHQTRRHDVIDGRKAFVLEDTTLERTRHSLVSSHLTSVSRQIIHAVGMIVETDRRDASNGLEPDAGRRVAPHFQVQMVTIAVHVVAQISSAGILNGCAARNDKAELGMHLHGILHSSTDAVVHHLLPVTIVGKASVRTIVRISPRLMVSIGHIRIGLQALGILYEVRQVRFKGGG